MAVPSCRVAALLRCIVRGRKGSLRYCVVELEFLTSRLGLSICMRAAIVRAPNLSVSLPEYTSPFNPSDRDGRVRPGGPSEYDKDNAVT